MRALGCRAPLSNLSSWYYPAQYLLPISRFDYMDSHFYVDHPAFLGKNWQFPSACIGDNPFRVGADVPAATWRRFLGKPFCITEWNWAAPGPFRSASGLAVGALAAKQGWSGLWRFAWSHDRAGIEAPGSLPMRYFDLHSDPVSLSSERATVMLFLRGDMAALPPESERAAEWDVASMLSGEMGAPRLGAPIPGVSPWKNRVGVRLGGASLSKSFVSPALSGDIAAATNGTFRVTTPRTCGGFAESGALECGALKFEIRPLNQSVANQSATVWASSLDSATLAASSRILVAHVTDARNTNALFDGDDARVWQKQGRTPVLVRRGRAAIELEVEGDAGDVPPSFAVFRLSPTGHRVAEVPCEILAGCNGPAPQAYPLFFRADTAYDPSCATIFYEIVRQQP